MKERKKDKKKEEKVREERKTRPIKEDKKTNKEEIKKKDFSSLYTIFSIKPHRLNRGREEESLRSSIFAL